MITSMDAEKASDKTQHLFMILERKQTRNRRKFLYSDKGYIPEPHSKEPI